MGRPDPQTEALTPQRALGRPGCREVVTRPNPAEEVARCVDAYLHDPTIERWDDLRAAHQIWSRT